MEGYFIETLLHGSNMHSTISLSFGFSRMKNCYREDLLYDDL